MVRNLTKAKSSNKPIINGKEEIRKKEEEEMADKVFFCLF
jgi:hypothetical protein